MSISTEVFTDIQFCYEDLRNKLFLKNKIKVNEPVLFSMMKMNSGDRLAFLSESSLDISLSIDQARYKSVENEQFMQRLHQKNRIILLFTAKGLYYMDEQKGLINHTKLLDYLQIKYFDLDVPTKKLNPNEKTVLFSLITMHCFGKSNCMDLSSTKMQQDWFVLVSQVVFPFLRAETIVTEKDTLNLGSTGNETPMTYLMRRQNDLSKKTGNIFNNSGNSKYYIDLDLEDYEKTKNLLIYLFKLLLPDKITFSLLEAIKIFMNSVFVEYVPLIHGRLNSDDDIWSSLINDSLDTILLQ